MKVHFKCQDSDDLSFVDWKSLLSKLKRFKVFSNFNRYFSCKELFLKMKIINLLIYFIDVSIKER